MPANQDFNAPRTTNGDFVIPESPVVVPRAAQSTTTNGSAPNEPLPTAWTPPSQPQSALSRAYNNANRGIGAVVERVALPQDDAPADLLGKLVSLTPPWFISLIVHFSIMIFLGLLVLGANGLMLGWWWLHRDRLRGFLRNWLLAQLAVLFLWGTWLPGFAKQVLHGDSYAWIPAPTVHRVVRGAFAVYGGPLRGPLRVVEALAVLALAGLGLWSWRRDRRWVAFALVFGLTASIGELIASPWRPIFLPRTLIWAAIPAHLAVAAGLLGLRPRVAFAVTLVVLVALSGWGLDVYYFHHDREAWDQVAAYVDRGLGRGDAIVFTEDFLRIPFDYYYRPPDGYSVPEIGLTGSTDDPSLVLQETATRGRVWLIVSHARPDTEAVLVSLGRAGRLTRVAQFTRVDVYLYDMIG
jgi:hypothetical protein